MLSNTILSHSPEEQKNILSLDPGYVQDVTAQVMVAMEQSGIGFNHTNSVDNVGRVLKSLCYRWMAEREIVAEDFEDIRDLLIKSGQVEVVQVLDFFIWEEVRNGS